MDQQDGQEKPSPIRRDGAIFCVDGDTGELVWRLMAYPNTANNGLSKVVMSDSRILYLDNHDNQIYCLGRGPSATTVSAPQLAPVLGASITITGTVTDQSPSGKHNINGDLDTALKGTPAIQRCLDGCLDGIHVPRKTNASKRNRCPSYPNSN